MRGWAWTSAVVCGITLALLLTALGVAVVAGILGARADRLCACGHTYGEHEDMTLLGTPCTVCQSCTAFVPAGRRS